MTPDDFRALFDSEAPAVLGRLRNLGVPARDRLDVAQDVFVEVFRARARFDTARPARPWITTITCNKARDYFKRARVRFELLVGLGSDDTALEAHVSRELDHLAAATLVRRLLRSLRYADREVLTLVDLEEHTVPEAAAVLGLTPKALESRLARARERAGAALARLRAAERVQLGDAAMVGLALEQLFSTARGAREDLGAELATLRERMERALVPPRSSTATPIAAQVGLATITFIAVVGAVDGLCRPRATELQCPPVAVQASAELAPEPPPERASEPAFASTAAPVVAAAAPRRASVPRAVVTSSPAASSAAASVSDQAAELTEYQLISLARRALNEGSPQRARVYLLRHARAYPKGSLAPERESLLRRAQGS